MGIPDNMFYEISIALVVVILYTFTFIASKINMVFAIAFYVLVFIYAMGRYIYYEEKHEQKVGDKNVRT